jgi:hypothetical protein
LCAPRYNAPLFNSTSFACSSSTVMVAGSVLMTPSAQRPQPHTRCRRTG